MRRRLARIFIGCCLALSLISASLYVLTHWRSDSWSRPGLRTWDIELRNGSVTVRLRRTELLSVSKRGEAPLYEHVVTERPEWPETRWGHNGGWVAPKEAHPALGAHLEWRVGQQSLGFSSEQLADLFGADCDGPHVDVVQTETHDECVLVIPLLGLSLLVFIPVLAALLAGLARRQRAPGSCIQCGYDIRYSRDRCPECGLGMTETKALRVGPVAPVLVSVALVLAAAVVFASWSTGQAVVASALHVPATDITLDTSKRPPIRVAAFAVWITDGTLLIAGTRDETRRSTSLPLRFLTDSTVPPQTGVPKLEPTIRVVDDNGRRINVLRLPIWLALLLLTGGAAAWIHGVHRRGGFRIAPISRGEPTIAAP